MLLMFYYHHLAVVEIDVDDSNFLIYTSLLLFKIPSDTSPYLFLSVVRMEVDNIFCMSRHFKVTTVYVRSLQKRLLSLRPRFILLIFTSPVSMLLSISPVSYNVVTEKLCSQSVLFSGLPLKQRFCPSVIVKSHSFKSLSKSLLFGLSQEDGQSCQVIVVVLVVAKNKTKILKIYII